MAVLPMRRISLYGLKSQRKEVLELLQRRGVVEVICRPQKEEAFSCADTREDREQFAALQGQAKRALEILDAHCPAKKSLFASLEGRKPLTLQEYEASRQKVQAATEAAARLEALEREREDLRAEKTRIQARLESLAPWLSLDVPLNAKGTRSTAVFIGTFPQPLTREKLLQELARRLREGMV